MLVGGEWGATPASKGLVSVVVPVHNEAHGIVELCREIVAVLDAAGETGEVLFVDDGSTDETAALLVGERQRESRVRVVSLGRNFGESSALSAGFAAARGEYVVTLDGDGQNDPADIPTFLDLLRDRPSLACVSGVRTERCEPYWTRVLPSRAANTLIAWLTGIAVRDCGCGLKAYRAEVVRGKMLPSGMNRFLPAVLGVRRNEVAEVTIRDRPRRGGASHYGLARVPVLLRDLVALPGMARGPRGAEIFFSLATAGFAVAGSLWVGSGRFVADALAAVCAVGWWGVRRFNHAQQDGVFEVREEDA